MKPAAICCLPLAALLACGADNGSGDLGPAEPLVTPVGQPQGPLAQRDIGPEGGSLASPDGRLTVEIPPGALAATTTITIQPITTEVPGPLGDLAYRLGPEGQTFATPATLRFTYDPAELGGNDPEVLAIAFQKANGMWGPVHVTSDAAAHTLSAQTPHFSDWTALRGFDITPRLSELATKATQALRARMCIYDPPACDALTDETCKVDCWNGLAGADMEWSVNGIPGGNSTVGTIEADPANARAIYTAPATVPNPNNVQVAARCERDCSPHGVIIMFGQVWIDNMPFYSGDVTVTQVQDLGGSSVTVHSEATVELRLDASDQTFHPTQGAVTATQDTMSADCASHVSYAGPLGSADGALNIFDNMYSAYGLVQNATFTGTSTCNDTHTEQPLTIPSSVAWWPAMSLYTIKPDGTLSESITDPSGGMTTTMQWTLHPH